MPKFFYDLRELWARRKQIIRIIKEKAKTPSKNNYKIGLHYVYMGKIKHAIFRFWLANIMKKNGCYKSLYQLAKCHLMLGNNNKSEKYFNKSLALIKSNNVLDYTSIDSIEQNILYFKQILSGKDFDSIKVEINKFLIKEYFENFSFVFNKLYIGYANYSLHKEMANIITEKYPNAVKEESRILELGCGNGFLGSELYACNLDKDLEIDGIDMSFYMIELAEDNYLEIEDQESGQRKNSYNDVKFIYSELLNQNIVSYTKNLKNEEGTKKYDLIMTRLLFNYMEYPKVIKIIAELSNILNVNGIFVFALSDKERDKELHNQEYIKESYPFYLKKNYHDNQKLLEDILNLGILSLEEEIKNCMVDNFNYCSIIVLKKIR